MTANQVAAIRAQEDKRHDLETEKQARNDWELRRTLGEGELMLKAHDVASKKIDTMGNTVKNVTQGFKNLMSPFSMF